MSERLKQYIKQFGHIVGTEFSADDMLIMEKVAAAYQKSYWDSFNADCQRIRDRSH